MNKLYAPIAKKATSGLAGLLIGICLMPLPVLARTPNDPNYAEQETMWNQIHAPEAWDYGTGSRKVVVAVIDTGVDIWHNDLRDNIWVNSGEIPDNGIDDDHNGFVDDVHGWNFVDNNNNVRTSVSDVQDDPEAVRHGTIIAGLIGAAGNNAYDGVGLNWHVQIMPLRAIDSSGSGSFKQVIAAVNYAVKNGANIISMSFIGEDPVGSLRSALYEAYKKGVVVVTAAGNHDLQISSGNLDSTPLYPACFDQGDSQNWLLTVAAVDASDHLSHFSDFGHCVDITAPGENIFSTERYAPQFGYNNEFGGGWEGTSFSAPLVAGAAALLKGLHPSWQPDAIISTLLSTADKIDNLNPEHAGEIGVGRLNIGRALASAYALEPPEATMDGLLYYHDVHTLWRRSIRKSAADLVAQVTDGEIISAAPVQGQTDDENRISLLFKHGPYYIARLISEKGTIVSHDFIVSGVSRRLVKGIKTFSLGADVFPVVEQFDPRSKKTIFTEFDADGHKRKDIVVAGTVDSWQIDAKNQAIIVSSAQSGSVAIKQLPLDDQGEALQITVPGAQAVFASAVGYFWPGSNQQVALVVRDDSAASLLVVDLPSGSYRFDEIQSNATPAAWKIVVVQNAGSDRQSLLPFQSSGGVFNVFNESGTTTKPVAIPKIDSKID